MEDTVRKIVATMNDKVAGKSTVECITNQKSKGTRRNRDGRNDETLTGDKKLCKADQKGNYWVEYWDEDTDRWICKFQFSGHADEKKKKFVVQLVIFSDMSKA